MSERRALSGRKLYGLAVLLFAGQRSAAAPHLVDLRAALFDERTHRRAAVFLAEVRIFAVARSELCQRGDLLFGGFAQDYIRVVNADILCVHLVYPAQAHFGRQKQPERHCPRHAVAAGDVLHQSEAFGYERGLFIVDLRHGLYFGYVKGGRCAQTDHKPFHHPSAEGNLYPAAHFYVVGAGIFEYLIHLAVGYVYYYPAIHVT